MMGDRQYRPSLLGPLVLIAAGVLLLLNQTGRLPWSVWGTLVRFWPVILILVGLEVLVGLSRSTVIYVLGLLVAVAVLAGVLLMAIYFGGEGATVRPPGERETISEPLQDADQAKIQLQLGVGTVNIGALTDSPNFAEGEIRFARLSRRPSRSLQLRGGELSYSLRAGGQPFPFLWPGSDRDENWTINFTPRIPLELDVSRGVGDINLDLSDLQVKWLEVGSAVGSTTVAFPTSAGITTAEIRGAIGDISVSIPKGVGARISVSKLLASADATDPRFVRSGDVYTTPDYETAVNKLDLKLELVIGSIVIR